MKVEVMIHKESAVVLVFNEKGELALQLRASSDDSYPAHWDFSAAGGIDSGEKPLAAALRELREELGVSGQLLTAGDVLYADETGDDNLHVFCMVFNGSFLLNPNEVEAEKFFSLEEIARMIAAGIKFHPEFIFVWNLGLIKNI